MKKQLLLTSFFSIFYASGMDAFAIIDPAEYTTTPGTPETSKALESSPITAGAPETSKALESSPVTAGAPEAVASSAVDAMPDKGIMTGELGHIKEHFFFSENLKGNDLLTFFDAVGKFLLSEGEKKDEKDQKIAEIVSRDSKYTGQKVLLYKGWIVASDVFSIDLLKDLHNSYKEFLTQPTPRIPLFHRVLIENYKENSQNDLKSILSVFSSYDANTNLITDSLKEFPSLIVSQDVISDKLLREGRNAVDSLELKNIYFLNGEVFSAFPNLVTLNLTSNPEVSGDLVLTKNLKLRNLFLSGSKDFTVNSADSIDLSQMNALYGVQVLNAMFEKEKIKLPPQLNLKNFNFHSAQGK